jgi:threonylcarbamoyladenosine tRNA methylthiotransferase MtaB
MSFAVVNLGCRVNRAESDAITQKLLQTDVLVPYEVADKVYINTCTVTGVAEKKTRKTVRRVLDRNNHAEVIVTGCAAEIAQDFFENLSDRVTVIPKHKILSNNVSLNFNTQSNNNSRVNVKIQDGCNNACTFCIVHVARGKSVSVPKEEVVKNCIFLDRAGVKEIVLTGINLGNYSDPSLSELVKHLLDNTQICRFRISSIEPPEVTDELIDTIRQAGDRVCNHFHLPLQSGSDSVLDDMHRHYSTSQFLELVQETRDVMPSFSFTTDIIVGFPGETDDDFQKTLDFAKEISFSKIHVFPYSKREGTPAADMPEQVPEVVKSERAKVLRELSDELRKLEFKKRIGTSEFVVTENDLKATTDSYFTIKSELFEKTGELLNVELKENMFFE